MDLIIEAQMQWDDRDLALKFDYGHNSVTFEIRGPG
jgi:hypothetical protein